MTVVADLSATTTPWALAELLATSMGDAGTAALESPVSLAISPMQRKNTASLQFGDGF